MRYKWIFLTVLSALMVLTVGLASAGGPPRAISVLGIAKVAGEDVIVDVLVVLSPEANANEAARAALEQQGARPFDSAELGSGGEDSPSTAWCGTPSR